MKFFTVTIAVGGQKLKNHPTKLYTSAKIVIGTPSLPKRNGPKAMLSGGVTKRRHNMTQAETMNAE